MPCPELVYKARGLAGFGLVIVIKIPFQLMFKLCIAGSISSGLSSPDMSGCRLSQQDMHGYATIRYLHRYNRPWYSDTVSLAAMELVVLDEHGHSPSSSRSMSASRGLKVHSLDRHYTHPGSVTIMLYYITMDRFCVYVFGNIVGDARL